MQQGGNKSSRALRKAVPSHWTVEADGSGEAQAAYAYEDAGNPRSDFVELGHNEHKPGDAWYAEVGGYNEARDMGDLIDGAYGLGSAEQAARAVESLIEKHLRGGGQTERQRSRMYSNRGGRADGSGLFDDLGF